MIVLCRIDAICRCFQDCDELLAWQVKSGFTLSEVALIQPTYKPDYFRPMEKPAGTKFVDIISLYVTEK